MNSTPCMIGVMLITVVEFATGVLLYGRERVVDVLAGTCFDRSLPLATLSVMFYIALLATEQAGVL